MEESRQFPSNQFARRSLEYGSHATTADTYISVRPEVARKVAEDIASLIIARAA
jgi:hypothetical protein